MKKILTLSFILLSVLFINLSNYSYATENSDDRRARIKQEEYDRHLQNKAYHPGVIDSNGFDSYGRNADGRDASGRDINGNL